VRLLVINPNRIEACTEIIRRAAETVASPGTEIVATMPDRGPVELAGEPEVLLSAVGVLDRIARQGADADAVVMAGFGEPGREAAQETTTAPVLDITECGPAVARLLGRKYTVVTSTEPAAATVEDRLHTLGLDGRCAGVLPTGLGVPDMVERPDEALKAFTDIALHSPGEVIVLGCAGIAGSAPTISQAIGRPVVDGVTAAVTLAESLVRLDVRASRAGSLAQRAAIPGWPLQ
jgi:allantoin racemase